MAREIEDLQAVVRTGTGKGAARQARREGNVPGIVYGDGKEPAPINLNYNYLLKRLRQGRAVSDVTFDKMHTQAGDLCHSGQGFGAGIGQVVKNSDLVARLQQLHTGVGAYVARPPGDKNHGVVSLSCDSGARLRAYHWCHLHSGTVP